MPKLLKKIALILLISLPVLALVHIWSALQSTPDLSSEILKHFALNWYILLPVLLLVLVNWGLESIKWRHLRKIHIKQAVYEVLCGVGLAFFTPNRVGEAGGRLMAIDKDDRWNSGNLFVYSSIAQSLSTVWGGLIGAVCLTTTLIPIPSYLLILITFFVLISGVLIYFNIHRLYPILPLPAKWKLRLNTTEKPQNTILIHVLGLSILRYLTFSGQYLLLLLMLAPDSAIEEVLPAIGLSYLITALIPGSLLAELGYRESVGILVIGQFTNPAAVALATFILWLLNLALPAIIGSKILAKRAFKLMHGSA